MMGRVRAPELTANLGWLNTDRPLSFAEELRGQVVVLDFWTYCCINCIHILPDLAYLEEKYADQPVTFIGVHSAKFSNEASRETIRAAILRYEIRHAVVIDEDMKIWRAYAARSWPTVVVVDAKGVVSCVAAGEGNRETLDQAIAQALAQGRAEGSLAPGPLELQREGEVRAASGLAFPGKVLADAAANRLFIADSNHNRILVAELPDENGHSRVLAVIGSGSAGRDDGPPDRATFNHPQGLAYSRGKLYVADTENHLIRAIDLNAYTVTTVVGTGELSNDCAGGAMGTAQGINSPWDLTIEGSTLYVAMAGRHQIWRIDLPVGFARALAGSGRENLADGPTETAALAQPSGICMLNGTIYFADSEVSAVRGIDMATEQVFTVIGEGLFVFGDVDGSYPDARLQHPLGVAPWGNVLLVADTYNHKIKVVDPGGRTVRTLLGTGKPEASAGDGQVAFFEPGGLSVSGQRLFVADTNNHRVVELDLATQSWREVVLTGISGIGGREEESETPTTKLAPVNIAPDRSIDLLLHPLLPEGAHLNGEAPWSVRISLGDTVVSQVTGKSSELPLLVKLPAGAVREGTWSILASVTYCTTADGGLCAPGTHRWTVPVRLSGTDSVLRLDGR
ncbi:MAG: redoxin domain-containing protein [Phycisphaerae bacterium]|nr:redoxin domain-containing protein [Phycisphaerae bacterium]